MSFLIAAFIYLSIYKILIQDGHFSIYIYIFTKHVKITAFQTSSAKKKRNKPLNLN